MKPIAQVLFGIIISILGLLVIVMTFEVADSYTQPQPNNNSVKQEVVSPQKSPQQIFEDTIHTSVDGLMKNLTYNKYTQTGQPDRCNATNVTYNSDKTFSMALVLIIPCYRIPPQLLKVESLDDQKLTQQEQLLVE